MRRASGFQVAKRSGVLIGTVGKHCVCSLSRRLELRRRLSMLDPAMRLENRAIMARRKPC